MTGKWTIVKPRVIHQCELPELEEQGEGSVWQCECGRKYKVAKTLASGELYLSRMMLPPPPS